MKLPVFLLILAVSAVAYAKNRVMYTVIQDPLKPQTDLYVIPDYKKPSTKKLIEYNVGHYASSPDMIVWMKGKKLFVITDFEEMTKIVISEEATGFWLKEGVLFYTIIRGKSQVLNVVHDPKTLSRIEVVSGYNDYGLDND